VPDFDLDFDFDERIPGYWTFLVHRWIFRPNSIDPRTRIMLITPNRRDFLAATAGASSFLLLPSGARANPAVNQLNVGFIGMGGQIQGHVGRISRLGHNIVALCDVDANQLKKSRARHKDVVAKAKDYGDYRKLLEDKSIDAVVIATPDHWHFPICKLAIEAGKHVYCEKPLTHTLQEARELRKLATASNVITQTGNQGSASRNLRRSMELIGAGLFGHISEVHIWHPAHGWPNGVPRPDGEDPIPDGLNWDFWCGPSPLRPYKTGIYHPVKWRGWYDFGNGSIGDFCCHSFNLPVRALDLKYPTRIEIDGEGYGFESYAKSVSTKLHFPATAKRGAVDLWYHTGGNHMPPTEYTDQLGPTFGKLNRVGCLMIGEKGILSAGLWNSECYVKLNDEEKFFGAGNHHAAKEVAQSVPRVEGHMDEWVDCISDNKKTYSPFEFGGHLTELGLAGVVALKLQRSIDWDGENMKVPGAPDESPGSARSRRLCSQRQPHEVALAGTSLTGAFVESFSHKRRTLREMSLVRRRS
jgi:predicted dehydrogenase